MGLPRKFGSPTFLSLIDQAAASATSFGVALALLLFGSQRDFAHFSLYWTYVVLANSVLTSALGVPLQLLAARQDVSARPQMAADYVLAQRRVLVALCAVAGVAVLAVGVRSDIGGLEMFLMVLAPPILWLREAQRTLLVALREYRLMAVQSAFGALMIVAGIALFYVAIGRISLSVTLGLLSVVTAINVIVTANRMALPRPDRQAVPELLRAMLPMARWSAPGSVIAWIIGQAYLSIAALGGGAPLVATLSSARLFVLPIVSVQTGIVRLNVSRAAAAQEAEGAAASRQVVLKASRQVGLMYLAYGVLVAALAGGALALDLLSPKYARVVDLVPLVMVLALVGAIRGLFVSLNQIYVGFRFTFFLALWVAVASMLGEALAIALQSGPAGYFLPLIAGELLMLTAVIVANGRYRA